MILPAPSARFWYSLALSAALPLALPYLAKKKRLNRQCFGFAPPLSPPIENDSAAAPMVWLHAVSAGEAAAAAGLIDYLHRRRFRLTLSHTTAAGGDCLRRRHGEYAAVCQLPLDLPGAMRRFMARVRPHLAIVMEAEYWPNMIAAAKNAGAKLLLANARLSAVSARRYARCAPLFCEMASAFDGAAAQTRADARRLSRFGMRNIRAAGNLKFDRAPDQQQIAAGREWRRSLPEGKTALLLAGSRPGEEALFLKAMDGEFLRKFFLIVAPRHRERGDEAASLFAARKIAVARRTRGESPADADMYLADTLGEMDFFYGGCDAAIIGGGFLPFGGQNPIEAMQCGVGAVVGPHVQNYRALVAEAGRRGALRQATDAAAALQIAAELAAASDSEREKRQQAAAELCAEHQGALAINAQMAMQLLNGE